MAGTPLTDAINALTTYSNTVTGASDTTLSEAVATLAAGYGGGGSGWTTEGIAQNTEPNGAITLKTYAKASNKYFAGLRAFQSKPITSVTFDFENQSVEVRGDAQCFANSGITSVSMINYSSSTSWRFESTFRDATQLTSFDTDLKINFGGYTMAFGNCTALTRLSVPNAFGAMMAPCDGCNNLEFADMGSATTLNSNGFRNCYKLQTLVLRKSDAIVPLGNVSAFANTPMRGYNSLSGEIYVPNALISTYQTASNWSTIYGEGHVTFKKIEGSIYEL